MLYDHVRLYAMQRVNGSPQRQQSAPVFKCLIGRALLVCIDNVITTIPRSIIDACKSHMLSAPLEAAGVFVA